MTTPSPLDRLRAAEKAIPEMPDAYENGGTAAEWTHDERALRGFWREAWAWEHTQAGMCDFDELDEARAIIDRVRSKHP